MNPIARAIVFNGIKYCLKGLKAYMSKPDFKQTCDEVLDRVENYFPDGTLADLTIEEITSELREYFDIPDNDENDHADSATTS